MEYQNDVSALDDAQTQEIERSVATHAIEVLRERVRQENLRIAGKFESTCASDTTSDGDALRILAEEVDETLDEADDLRRTVGRLTRLINDEFGAEKKKELENIRGRMRTELMQVASVAFGWLEKIDRQVEKGIENGNSWIGTNSGARIDVTRPDIEQIHIGDIAWSLAREGRFCNILEKPYSVAQHCVLASRVADRESPQDGPQALLHDATEAFMRDIPTPFKKQPAMGFYRIAERRLETIIYEKFGLPHTMSEKVREIDYRMLLTEKRDLLPENMKNLNLSGEPYDFVIKKAWGRKKAYKKFVEAYNTYVVDGKIKGEVI